MNRPIGEEGRQNNYSISDVRRAIRAQARQDMWAAYEAYERALGRDPGRICRNEKDENADEKPLDFVID